MIQLLSLAWRNLWRNSRRTLISLGAVGLGLFLVIIYAGLVAGLLGDAASQMDSGGMGHVEITAPGFRAKKSAALTLPGPAAWASGLQLPAGSQTGGRLSARGLAVSARGSDPAEILGVSWDDEVQLSAHLRDVRQGALPAPGDKQGALVGEQLAERLQLKVGGKLRLMVQRADGELGADLFRVRGIYHSISPDLARRQVIVSQDAAGSLLGLEGGVVHQYVIQLTDPDAADALAASLQSSLGPSFEVKSYGDLLPVLRRLEALTDNVVFAIATFVYLLVGLGILNTTLMSVLERTREFGVLMAVGTRPGRIVAIVLAESFWIATLAVVGGALLGALFTSYFHTHTLLDYSGMGESFAIEGSTLSTNFKTAFVPADILKASLFVYLMALLVGLYPATRVTRLQPAEALRRA